MSSQDEEETGPQIVKTKQFTMKPMSAEEAALQLELIGHDFFVFRSEDSLEFGGVREQLVDPGLDGGDELDDRFCGVLLQIAVAVSGTFHRFMVNIAWITTSTFWSRLSRL